MKAMGLRIPITALKPLEVFDKLCEAFERHTFPKDAPSWQDDIREFFEDIGHHAGFDTDREFLNLDLIWYLDLPNLSRVELALEHENHTCHSRLDPVLEEVDKLRHVKAGQKWMIYYPKHVDIERHQSRIAQQALASNLKQDPPEEWLLLTLTDDTDKWDSVDANLFELTSNMDWQTVGNRVLRVRYG